MRARRYRPGWEGRGTAVPGSGERGVERVGQGEQVLHLGRLQDLGALVALLGSQPQQLDVCVVPCRSIPNPDGNSAGPDL